MSRVSGDHATGRIPPAETVAPETSRQPWGAVYGRSFKPAPKTMKTDPNALDPVLLTTVTKSGNTTDGWILNATWTGGTAPYTAVSSTDPGFQTDVITDAAEYPLLTLDFKVDASDPGKFFNIVDGTIVSPAVQGLGLDPLPAPHVTTASTVNAWWGDRITLSGKYFSPIASENLAFLNDLGVRAADAAPPSSGSFSDTVEFDIPQDARSFLAVVYSYGKGDRTGAPAVFMSPPAIGPYTQITGVSWSPRTGHVWVAAQGVVEDVDLFQVTPTANSVGTFSRPYTSRVTTAGKILVIDRDASGVIQEIDPATRSINTFAWTMDDGFSRVIDPVGLAVDPDGSVAYVADGGTGRVVRIPRNAGPGSSDITDQWGGQDFSFVDPVGIDVAPGHQVIVADNASQYTWQITGPSNASSQHWAGQNVHAVEIDRGVSDVGYARYVIDTSPGMTQVFNRNPIGSQAQARNHGGRVYGLSNGTLRLNYDWVYGDLRRGPKKVLLSNAVSSFPYPTQFQTTDRVIELKGEAWYGVDVRLRLIDPPDLAAYAPDGGWNDSGDTIPPEPPYEGNDNVIWGWTGGEDYGLSLSPAGPWSETVFATPGVDHTYTYYLKVPPDNSGENFQVEIAKCDTSGAVLPDQVVGMSGVYTTWKRIFVERDKMFRKGGVLAEDYLVEDCGGAGQDPCCGDPGQLPCNQISVYEWTNVDVGDLIVVFDEWAAATDFSLFLERLFPVVQVVGIGAPDAYGLRILTLDGPMQRNFRASTAVQVDPPADLRYQPTFSNQRVSGFGVASDCDLDWNQVNSLNSCFYDVDLRGMERTYGDAFVELFGPLSGSNVMPTLRQDWFVWEEQYEAENPEPYPLDEFTWLWFENASTEASNYRQILGVSSIAGALTHGVTNCLFKRTLLFRGGIELWGSLQDPPATVAQLDNYTQDTTNHELGHHFRVQICPIGDGGHHTDTEYPKPAWCSPPWTDPGVCPLESSSPELCLMNSGDISMNNSQGWDPVFRFCEECLILGDPDCSGSPRDGAIRTEEDPLQ